MRDGGEARSWLARHKRAHLVLGTETLESHGVLEEFATDGRIVLSLDYRGDSFLGLTALCDVPHRWPARVIVMSMARVGGDAGPDKDRLADNAARRMSRFMPRMAFAAPPISCDYDKRA